MAKLSEVVDGLLAPQGAPRSAASNPGTLYEGRSFRGDAMGPRPVGVSDRPDMNVPAAPPAPPGPQRSELGKGFQTGLEGMKELNWSAVAALGQIFGSETVQKWGLENAEAANQRAQETLPRIARIEDIGGARDFVDWTLGTLGQLAPFALESAATAIAGAVVGGAMAGPAGAGAGALAGAGRSGAVKEAIKAAAKGTATPAQQQAARQAMARLGSQVGVVASGYKTGFGDVYNETVEGGDPSPGLAAIAAAPYAALDALPEMVLVNQISKLFGREGAQEVARGLIQRVGIGAVKQALLEGGTEGGQEALLILARRAVQPGYDPTGEETKSRLMNAVAAGAVGGGTIGGAAAAFDTGGPAAAQPGAAVPPGGTVPPGGDVAIDTLEAQPAAPARGIPAPPGSATVSPLMPSGEAQLQPTPTAPAAGQVAPAVPIDAAVPPVDAAPPMEQPPVTAGIPAAPVAPTSRVAPPVADPVAAPVADVATVAAPPAVAGIPQSADAAALLGDDDFNAAAADLGAILQPEPPAAVEPPAAPEPGAIGQELEALAPAKPAKPAKLSKEQRKAQARKAYRDANPFKSFLSDHGVSIDAKLDILGDRKAKNPPVPYGKGPVFRKNGMGLDELASYALQMGFITQAQMDDPTDNGATRLLADMIRRQLDGGENIQTLEGEQDGLADRVPPEVEAVYRDADRLGIPHEGRNPADVYEEVLRAQAQAAGVDPDGKTGEDIRDELEQAEINRLMAEAADEPADVIERALELDPDARIAIAMQLDDAAVERAARAATDDVDFWNQIEGIIDAGRGRGRSDSQPADADGAGGGGARSDAEPRVSGGRGEGRGGDEDARPGTGGERREDAVEPDPDERAGAQPDRQGGGSVAPAADGEKQQASRKKVKRELESLASKRGDGVKFGDVLGEFTFDLPAGPVKVVVKANISPAAYAEIYKEPGGILGFDLSGAVNSETGKTGLSGVIYKGPLTPERMREISLEVAEKYAAKPGLQPQLALQGEAPTDQKPITPGPSDADPLANNYAALEGKTVVQTVQMDGGKSATLKMDAAKALRGFDERIAALKALGDCIARPK